MGAPKTKKKWNPCKLGVSNIIFTQMMTTDDYNLVATHHNGRVAIVLLHHGQFRNDSFQIKL